MTTQPLPPAPAPSAAPTPSTNSSSSQTTTSPSHKETHYLPWIALGVFIIAIVIFGWAVFAQINTIVTFIGGLLAFAAFPCSILQINPSAFKTFSDSKKVGLQVFGLFLLLTSISVNGIFIFAHSANAATNTPIAPSHTSNVYPTPSSPSPSPTPALVEDGTKTLNKALNCPSTPLSFTLTESTIQNHITTLAITIYNPGTIRQSVSNSQTTIILKSSDQTQTPSTGSGFTGRYVNPSQTITETVYFTFVPLSQVIYNLHANITVGNRPAMRCDTLQLTFS